MIKLIIGLGNPGPEYKDTYHNAGFIFIDYFKKKNDSSYSLLATRYSLKSNVYMNESGGFIKKALKKNRTKPEELLVAHDDSDLEIGKYKLSFDRGAAGHNGVRSVIDALGTKKFWRLRIGVRPVVGLDKANPASLKLRRARAGDFVLKKISKGDREKIAVAVGKAAGEILGS